MTRYTRQLRQSTVRKNQKSSVLPVVALITGVFFLVVSWIVSIAASLAVPALAIWALGHFAFGWW